ncbi:hypothetical protein GCM10023200_26820 [Actinomycetospora chlora]|uniref:Uncharacterized protein n=1 Tax=Actinomycetospora chlora TaxID=663608 RepID=A0ABP9B4K1_9PSEU
MLGLGDGSDPDVLGGQGGQGGVDGVEVALGVDDEGDLAVVHHVAAVPEGVGGDDLDVHGRPPQSEMYQH